MVVEDFHVLGRAFPPDKADPPLVVDPDAVLTPAVAFQGFQPVPRRHLEILKGLGRVDHLQLPARNRFNRPEPPDGLPLKQPLGVLAAEGADHRPILTDSVNRVNNSAAAWCIDADACPETVQHGTRRHAPGAEKALVRELRCDAAT